MLKKTVKEEVKKEIPEAKVESFSNFKGKPMVRITGNFFGGGFNISKNKVKAIFENEALLKDFSNGKYDQQISELTDNEVLAYEQ